MVTLFLVAVAGVMLLVDGVIPIVPSSLPSSSIPSVNPPPLTKSPSGFYGYGRKYRLNLYGYLTPKRIKLESSIAALYIFERVLMKMREQGFKTDMNNMNRGDVLVDKYQKLYSNDEVIKIQYTLEAIGRKKYKCVAFGYHHRQTLSAGMIDTACKPL